MCCSEKRLAEIINIQSSSLCCLMSDIECTAGDDFHRFPLTTYEYKNYLMRSSLVESVEVT